jgi:hypothetical protein
MRNWMLIAVGDFFFWLAVAFCGYDVLWIVTGVKLKLH